MSERKWPTRWRPRLRLAAVVGLLLAVVTTARAEWVVLDYSGTPTDVEVWAPGVYSVATDQGAWLTPGDGGVPVLVSAGGPTAGTYLNSTGCLLSFLQSGNVLGNPCTPNGDPILDTFALERVKVTESGAAYAVAQDTFAGDSLIGFTPNASLGGETRPWATREQLTALRATKALGVLRMGNADDALVALNTLSSAHLRWYRDGAYQASYVLLDSSADVQAIDLFPGGASTPTALLGWTTGLYRGTLADAGTNPFSGVPLPGGAWTVTGVDVNTDAGSPYGDGFGMATAVRDGGAVALMSAVPATQPGEIGTRWQVNPTYQSTWTPPRYLACHGAEFCVIALNKPDAGNVLLYSNKNAPTLTVDPDTSVAEGETRTFSIRADDLDGDALRLTVEPRTLDTPALAMSTTEVNGGVDLQLTGRSVCTNTAVPVRVTASDGLKRNERSASFDVQVVHTRPPDPPAVSSPLTVVQAGLQAPPLTAAPAANAPCPIVDYVWSEVSPGGNPLTTSGASADFPFFDTQCAATGANYVYRVQAVDGAGLVSAPTEFTLHVKPWGLPLAPFDLDGLRVDLTAGQSQTLVPLLEHGCSSAPGYPGVDTLWELTQGTLPAPGIRLRAADDTLVTGTFAVTPRLTVETDACAAAQLAFTVRHYTRDGSGLEGPASPVQVSVDPNWIPISSGQLVLTSTTSTPEGVAGMVDVEGLNCVEQRVLQARVQLEREDGSVVREGRFPAPGSWSFPLGDVCEGGTYRVSGALLEGPGSQAQAVGSITVVVPPVKISLEPRESLRLTASCGEGARGTLEQSLPQGPCAALPLTWEQLGGPALTQATFVGQRIDVATQETDFGALIGDSVVLRVTANTGEVSQIVQSVPITAEPFIELHRRTERPTGAETELLGVSVELRNTTACGVSEVRHVERLAGVDYIPGSARFNGAPVEAELEGDALTVRGLVLEGGTTGQLTYVVRPRLLGRQRFEGQASLRGVPISQPLEAPASGCGCSGGGSGAAALGLAGLAAALRRRRRA